MAGPPAGAGVRFLGQGFTTTALPVGLDANVQVPNAASLQIIGALTLAGWFYIEDFATYRTIISKGASSSEFDVYTSPSTGALVVIRFGGGSPVLNAVWPAPPLGRWVHITVADPRTSGQAAQVYYDGAVQTRTTTTADTLAAISAGTAAVRIGSRSDQVTWLRGKAAGVKVYNRALSAAEAAELAAGRGVDRTGLVLDLPLDEGVGVKALDRSGLNNDGTLANGARWVQPKAHVGMQFGDATNAEIATTITQALDGPLTVGGWVYRPPSAPGRGHLASKGFNDDFDFVVEPDGAMTFYHGPAAQSLQSPSALVPVGWSHVIVVRSAKTAPTVSFFVNGVVAYSGTMASVVPANPSQAFIIGGRPAASAGMARGFVLSACVLYARALSQAEVRAVMLGQDPRSIPGCVAWYPLDGDTLNRAAPGTRARNMLARNGYELDAVTAWRTPDSANDVIGAITYPVRAQTLRRATIAGTAILSSQYAGTQMVVTPGQQITMSVDVASLTGEDIAGVFVQARFAGSATTFSSSTVTARGSDWTRAYVTFTVPSGATTMSAWLQAPLPNTTATVIARNWTVAEGASSAFVPASEMEMAPAVHGTPVNAPRLVRARARDGMNVGGGTGVLAGATLPLTYTTPGLAPYTFAAWARLPFPPPAPYRIGGRYSTNGRMETYVSSTQITFRRLAGGVDNNVSATVDTGRWFLMCGTYDGALLRLYLDGIPIGSAAHAGSWATEALTDHVLGAAGGTGSAAWAGAIGATREWTRVLSADEVAGLMVDSVPRNGLVGEWLTPGSVQGAVVLDTSGNGNHGRLVGSAVAA